ncbi:transcriptional regulator [Streptomyces arboris]|uniref:MmyB family transcriptional regulator n=1 Tax=Streptomyces arboris TaxID=2600619 RepID=UPI003BF59CC2
MTRRHLYHLAGLNPGLEPHPTDAQAHPRLRELLQQSAPCAAFVLSPCLDLLAANPPARAVLSPLGEHPNILRALLTRLPQSVFFTDRQAVADACLSALRENATHLPDDPGIQDIIAELADRSPGFTAMWQQTESAVPFRACACACAATVLHPVTGPLTLTYRSVGVPAAPGQRLVVGAPAPGSRDAEALTFLTAMTAPA